MASVGFRSSEERGNVLVFEYVSENWTGDYRISWRLGCDIVIRGAWGGSLFDQAIPVKMALRYIVQSESLPEWSALYSTDAPVLIKSEDFYGGNIERKHLLVTPTMCEWMVRRLQLRFLHMYEWVEKDFSLYLGDPQWDLFQPTAIDADRTVWNIVNVPTADFNRILHLLSCVAEVQRRHYQAEVDALLLPILPPS